MFKKLSSIKLTDLFFLRIIKSFFFTKKKEIKSIYLNNKHYKIKYMINYNNKNQVSVEYLILISVVFGLIFTLIGLFISDSQGVTSTLDKKHIQKVFKEITSQISKIYFLGDKNRVTFKTMFPDGILNLSIYHIENKLVEGNITSFDYFAITYYQGGVETEDHFIASKNYIRFNCSTNCLTKIISSGAETKSVTYWNDTSVFGAGDKKILIESQGDWVSIDFVR
jgi:hypothetical protein